MSLAKRLEFCRQCEVDLMKQLLLIKADMIEEREINAGSGYQTVVYNAKESECYQELEETVPQLTKFGPAYYFNKMSICAKNTEHSSSYFFCANLASLLQGSCWPRNDSITHLMQLAKIPPVPKKAEDEKPYTLILDLDETLIHQKFRPQWGAELEFYFKSLSGEKAFVSVRLRPNVKQFLDNVKDLFEVILFTASTQDLGEPIVQYLDPTGSIFKTKLYRQHCCYGNKKYRITKDISCLNRNPATTILIDNGLRNFHYQLDNSVPIVSFYDDEADNELMELLPILKDLLKLEDVRPRLRQLYGLHRLISVQPKSDAQFE